MIEQIQILFQALGLTLVHFCWQAALIAGVAKLIDFSLPGLRPRGRYAISLGALLVMAAAAVTTFAYEQVRLGQGQHVLANDAAALGAAVMPQGLPQGFDVMALLPWIDGAWAAGVLFLSARMLTGLWAIHRLKKHAQPAPEALAARFHRAVRALGLGQVQLRIHAGIDSPFVVGIFRSIVYLPVSAVTTLSPDQIDAVLAHELEHIRRADFAWNLIQTAMETIFFYHPAVWWLGRRLREQRELACDDAAVRSCDDPVTYATALLRLEEQRRLTPHLAVALNGDGSGPTLLSRVRRILGDAPQGNTPMKTRNAPRPAVLAIPLALATLAALAFPAAQVAAGTESSLSKACKIKTDAIMPIASSDDGIVTEEKPAAAATDADVEPKDFWSGLMPRPAEPDTQDFRHVDGKDFLIETKAEGDRQWTWVNQVRDWAVINTANVLGNEEAHRANIEALHEAAEEARREADKLQTEDSVHAQALRDAAAHMAEQAKVMEANATAQARNTEAHVRNADIMRIQAEAHARAAEDMARKHEAMSRKYEAQAQKMARNAEKMARKMELKARRFQVEYANWPADLAPPEPPAPPAPPAPPTAATLPALPAPPAPPAAPAPAARPAPAAMPAPPAPPADIAVIAPVKVKVGKIKVNVQPSVVVITDTRS